MKKFKLMVLTSVIVLGYGLINQTVYAQEEQRSNANEVVNIVRMGNTLAKTHQRIDLDELKQATEKVKEKKVKKVAKTKTLEEVYAQLSSNMNVNAPCGLSKEDFINLLENMQYDYNGVFARNASYIWELEQKYKVVNALFVCGIAANESLWCSSDPAVKTNNYTSQMKKNGKLIPYESEKECFEKTFRNLANNYLVKGGKYHKGYTMNDVGKSYCKENPKWADEVCKCTQMLFD